MSRPARNKKRVMGQALLQDGILPREWRSAEICTPSIWRGIVADAEIHRYFQGCVVFSAQSAMKSVKEHHKFENADVQHSD
jgi:hypothetical protein